MQDANSRNSRFPDHDDPVSIKVADFTGLIWGYGHSACYQFSEGSVLALALSSNTAKSDRKLKVYIKSIQSLHNQSEAPDHSHKPYRSTAPNLTPEDSPIILQYWRLYIQNTKHLNLRFNVESLCFRRAFPFLFQPYTLNTNPTTEP